MFCTLLEARGEGQGWGAGRSRSRLEKKLGAGAAKKLADSSALRDDKKHKEIVITYFTCFMFFCSFTSLVFGEKNILPNLTNSQEPVPFFFGPLEPEPLEKYIQLLFAFPLKIRKLLFAFPFRIRQFLFAFSFNTGVYIKFEMYFPPPFLIYIFSPNEI